MVEYRRQLREAEEAAKSAESRYCSAATTLELHSSLLSSSSVIKWCAGPCLAWHEQTLAHLEMLDALLLDPGPPLPWQTAFVLSCWQCRYRALVREADGHKAQGADAANAARRYTGEYQEQMKEAKLHGDRHKELWREAEMYALLACTLVQPCMPAASAASGAASAWTASCGMLVYRAS